MLTVKEVAQRYGVSRMVVDAWIERGELRAINVAIRSDARRRYRVEESALTEFEAKRRLGDSAPLRRPGGELRQFV